MYMKIVISQNKALPNDVLRGYANAFGVLKHDVVGWNSRLTPIFDIFDIHHPDLFIASITDVSRGVAAVLKENSSTAVLLHSRSFAELSGEDIEGVKQLKLETGKPDFVFSALPDDWEELGFKTLTLEKAADKTLFYPVEYDDLWSSDVVYCGNYSEELEDCILPLCSVDRDFSFRIYGEPGWSVPNYVGAVAPENIRKIYSSSKVILNLFPDETDVDYNVTACGGLCLSYDIFSAKISDVVRQIEYTLQTYNRPTDKVTYLSSYEEKVPVLLETVGL